MKLIIMSRKDIEAKQFVNNPTVAICIAYLNGRLHKVNVGEKLLAVHHTRFSDCDGDSKWCFPACKTMENIPVPMTRGQAIDILDFVEKWKDKVNEIHIACYGGVSRSAGVAAGLAMVFGWEDNHIYKYHIPNIHCKNLIRREFQQEDNAKHSPLI